MKDEGGGIKDEGRRMRDEGKPKAKPKAEEGLRRKTENHKVSFLRSSFFFILRISSFIPSYFSLALSSFALDFFIFHNSYFIL